MQTKREKAIEALDSQQYALAIELMTPLAESGDIEAQCDLGTLYQTGLGTPRNLEKALFWLEKAVDGGSGLAAHNLGTLYMTCLPDWPLDPDKSRYWKAKAKELGFKPG